MHFARTILMVLGLLLATAPAGADDPRPHTHEFEVSGMTCALCPVRIEKGLEAVEGVDRVSVDAESGRVRVVARAPATAATLEAAIEAAGHFEAELVIPPGDADPS